MIVVCTLFLQNRNDFIDLGFGIGKILALAGSSHEVVEVDCIAHFVLLIIKNWVVNWLNIKMY